MPAGVTIPTLYRLVLVDKEPLSTVAVKIRESVPKGWILNSLIR